jgi:hypothetical protein
MHNAIGLNPEGVMRGNLDDRTIKIIEISDRMKHRALKAAGIGGKAGEAAIAWVKTEADRLEAEEAAELAAREQSVTVSAGPEPTPGTKPESGTIELTQPLETIEKRTVPLSSEMTLSAPPNGTAHEVSGSSSTLPLSHIEAPALPLREGQPVCPPEDGQTGGIGSDLGTLHPALPNEWPLPNDSTRCPTNHPGHARMRPDLAGWASSGPWRAEADLGGLACSGSALPFPRLQSERGHKATVEREQVLDPLQFGSERGAPVGPIHG